MTWMHVAFILLLSVFINVLILHRILIAFYGLTIRDSEKYMKKIVIIEVIVRGMLEKLDSDALLEIYDRKLEDLEKEENE